MLNAQIANLSSKLEYAIECKKRKDYAFRFLSDMTELLDLISDIDCKADDEGVNMLQNMDESMDSDSVINLSKTALKKISSGLQSTKVSCRQRIVANAESAEDYHTLLHQSNCISESNSLWVLFKLQQQ